MISAPPRHLCLHSIPESVSIVCNSEFDVFSQRDYVKGVNVRCEASDCFHLKFIAPGQLFSSFQHDLSWLLPQSLS